MDAFERVLNQSQQRDDVFGMSNEQAMNVVITRLVAELQKDKEPGSYYYVWQANIAMSFYDSVRQQLDPKNKGGNLYDDSFGDGALHQAANNAAKNFLDLLISQSDSKI